MPENYRALTRTYRPVSFDDIVSQEHVSSTLKNAIKQNRLAHAYMFCGPRGVGKTSMARVLARTVNEIDQQIDGESLNRTLNVMEIDAASNNSVDDVRDLRERVRIPPQNGRYKVYIIDEVHMLSKQAFNALLKTLEEPPDHIIFIFATTEPHKVLPTILSRVQRFDFKRIGMEDIVERLKKVCREENISIDEESLHVIAKKAEGALRDALGLLDQAIAFCGSDIQHEQLLRALNVVSTDRMFEFMQAVEQRDASRGFELISDLLHEGYDIQEYLAGLTEHIRNLYVADKSENMHLVEASAETKRRYKEASKTFGEDDLMRMLHLVSEAQYKIKEAQQPKIQFEITLLKLIHMERSRNLDTLISELQQLKKKLGSRPATLLNGTNGQEDAENGMTGKARNHRPRDDKKTELDSEDEKAAPDPEYTTSDSKDKETAHDSEEGSGSGEHTTSADSSGSESDSTTETGPSPDPVKTKSTSANRLPQDDRFDQVFGSSSLGKQPSADGVPVSAPAKPDTPASPKRAPKEVSLEEIKGHWADFIEQLRQEVPQMLYFQMQRVDPIRLQNGTLLLRCNDDFAKQIVGENKRRLGKVLEQQIHAFLNIDCQVQKNEDHTRRSMSPYERFKKLQERDPTIKTLVDLFGAELDYNLNQ